MTPIVKSYHMPCRKLILPFTRKRLVEKFGIDDVNDSDSATNKEFDCSNMDVLRVRRYVH